MATPAPPSVTTEEVSFPSLDKTFELFGDLTLPSSASAEEPVPAILILSGSGPIDRHGNVPGFLMGMSLNTSNRFAEQIHRTNDVQRKVAVLSYDKRGVGKSQRSDHKDLFYTSGPHDFVDDALQALQFLAQHPRIDGKRLIVLGHSEGAILMPLLVEALQGKTSLPPLLGCILLAGLGETVFSAMSCQQQRTLEEVQKESGFKGWILRKQITQESLEQQLQTLLKDVDDNPDQDMIRKYFGLVKIPAKWFREHRKYSAPNWEAISCHCLAITGEKDIQVRSNFCDPTSAKSLLSRAASVETHRPPNLTHVLRSVGAEPKILEIQSEYPRQGKMPVDDELMATIGSWCDRILEHTS